MKKRHVFSIWFVCWLIYQTSHHFVHCPHTLFPQFIWYISLSSIFWHSRLNILPCLPLVYNFLATLFSNPYVWKITEIKRMKTFKHTDVCGKDLTEFVPCSTLSCRMAWIFHTICWKSMSILSVTIRLKDKLLCQLSFLHVWSVSGLPTWWLMTTGRLLSFYSREPCKLSMLIFDSIFLRPRCVILCTLVCGPP